MPEKRTARRTTGGEDSHNGGHQKGQYLNLKVRFLIKRVVFFFKRSSLIERVVFDLIKRHIVLK